MTQSYLVTCGLTMFISFLVTWGMPTSLIKIIVVAILMWLIYKIWSIEFRTYQVSVTATLEPHVPVRFRRYLPYMVKNTALPRGATMFVRFLLLMPIGLTLFESYQTIMAMLVAITMIVILGINRYVIIPMYRENVVTAVVDQLSQVSCESHLPATSPEGPESLATNPQASTSSPDAPHR